MTRVEIKRQKKKWFFINVAVLLIAFLVPFLIGFLTHWCICKFNHEDVQKVEHTGIVTVYVSEKSKTSEVTEPIENTKLEEIKLETKVEESEAEKEEVEVKEKEFVSYYTYTEEELDLLARLIYSEGGTESYDTKLKIGSVVMNRVSEDTYFPDTIREVIYQKNQFSVTTYKINGVIMIDRPADEESKRAAKEVLDYGSVLPQDVQVFYAEYISDRKNWVTSRKVYEVCDNTVFAYIYEG